MLEKNRIPCGDPRENPQSLHIDATLFGKFVENKFKNLIEIVDGVIENVVVDNSGIKELQLTDGRVIKGDFFIDASGFQSILMKSLENEWVDMSDWLPVDRCIPNPLPYTFNTQPPYTTSEATEDGWILQVPLSNRWGTGYLYSSNFLSEEKAFEKFEYFVEKNYNSKLNNTSRVLKFKSGYWKKQWVKNCICVGLSSGFAEPLEATNIHHTVDQIINFVHFHNCTSFISEHSVEKYNKKMIDFYRSVYLYLRFCYDTKRTDSEFWKYLTGNTPKEVDNINEMLHNGIISNFNLDGSIFIFTNFIVVGKGQNKINVEAWRGEMERRSLSKACVKSWHTLKDYKNKKEDTSIDHLQYITSLKPR
jgi:tryptophan halogenase